MFVEIGLIQRTSIFLGHPIYALSIVLFSIILWTGLGSLLSERFALEHPRGIAFWLAPLVVYLMALPFALTQLTHSSLEAAGVEIRALACVLIMAPAGLLMGFGFPMGMRLIRRRDPRPAPWFWGINGAAGVLAAGLATTCSMVFSIDATIRVGAVCYLLLIPAAFLLCSRSRTGPSA
jgi:hypothetical protein